MSVPEHAIPNGSISATWLLELYGSFESGHLSLFSIDRAGARQVDWSDLGALTASVNHFATRIGQRAEQGDVWLGVASRKAQLPGVARGGVKDCAELPGLWLDVDIEGPGHAAEPGTLPPSLDAALDLVKEFRLPPTALVHSGGGIQGWWLFAEPVEAQSDQAASLLADWGFTWSQLARAHGWRLDNVYNVDRVMRIPGTANWKTGEPRPVELLGADWDRRYGFDDIDAQLLPVPPPEPGRPPSSVPYIGPQRAGDAFNARHSASELLEQFGCTRVRSSGPDEHYVRPGASSDKSATVYADDGHATIWSDELAAQMNVLTRRPYDAFALYVHARHRGNWGSAAKDLVSRGYGESWSVDGMTVAQAAALVGQGPGSTDLPPEPGPPIPPTLIDEVRAKLLFGDDITQIPPKSPLVHGWIDRGDFGVLYGRPGSGKSFLALDIAGCIATGTRWHGADVEQGNVVYLVAEGAQGMAKRWVAWKRQNDVFTDHRSIIWAPIRANLRAAQWAEALAVVFAEHSPSLVVIDTLARTFGGGNENASEDMGAYIAGADEIRELTGASVLIVHHTGKDQSQGGRGHSSLLGAIDVELELKATDNRIYLESTKQKDHEIGEPLRLGLKPLGDSAVIVSGRDLSFLPEPEPDPEPGPKLTDQQQLVFDLFLELLGEDDTKDYVMGSEWQNSTTGLSVSKSSHNFIVQALVSKGLVQRLGTRRNYSYALVRDLEGSYSPVSPVGDSPAGLKRLVHSPVQGGPLKGAPGTGLKPDLEGTGLELFD